MARAEPVYRAWRSSTRSSSRLSARSGSDDEIGVEEEIEPLRWVVHEGLAAGHARAEVQADVPSTTTVPAVMYSHVVADLDDRDGARVAHGEALAADLAQKSLPPVAPYSAVFPTRHGSPASSTGGEITIRPPLMAFRRSRSPRRRGGARPGEEGAEALPADPSK